MCDDSMGRQLAARIWHLGYSEKDQGLDFSAFRLGVAEPMQ